MPSDYLFEAAFNSLGIYPQAVTISGVTTQRDRYGEGWNEAQSTCRARHIEMIQWYRSLPAETQDAFDLLSEVSSLSVDFDDGKVSFALVVNDVFFPAAHFEPIEATDLPILASLYKQFGHEGVYAWASKQIGVEPRRLSPEARSLYTKALASLQDAT